MIHRGFKAIIQLLLLFLILGVLSQAVIAQDFKQNNQALNADAINAELDQLLKTVGFTGRIESSLTQRLGRKLDRKKIELGKNLFFDSILGLRGDNSCAGCHSPKHGFGDTQSIAIGILNNKKVGSNRSGPRNQRRSPMLLNVAFFPRLMWNSRFAAGSGDPFDNSQGFIFPFPEGVDKFPANDEKFKHLLVAQAHIPSTELVEMTGMRGTTHTLDRKFLYLDDGRGFKVPDPDPNGNRNDAIREKVLEILNKNKAYKGLFAKAFPDLGPDSRIEFTHIGQALAEFEFSLTRANAPIDKFARGDKSAMKIAERRGAVIFFGKAGCVNCHAVGGKSFEMFSDFENHRIGVPQLTPVFGKKTGDVIFDGPESNQDFGAEQISGNSEDRYKFRTSPLRNVALQPTFFHDGAFTRLEDAVSHHLDVVTSVRNYNPERAGVKKDLQILSPVTEPLLENLDPLVKNPVSLSNQEFNDLVQFLKTGLLDSRVSSKELCKLIPERLPSGRKLQEFEDCK